MYECTGCRAPCTNTSLAGPLTHKYIHTETLLGLTTSIFTCVPPEETRHQSTEVQPHKLLMIAPYHSLLFPPSSSQSRTQALQARSEVLRFAMRAVRPCSGASCHGRGTRRVGHTSARCSAAPKAVADPLTTAATCYEVAEINGSRVTDLMGGPRPSAAAPSNGGTQTAVSSSSSTPPPQEQLIQFLEALFMPPGYPASTTPDYLSYQLWSMPTHITGHLSHSLTTSSLLAAVGIGAGPLGTAAASAAIRWIIKDGIGALGRLVIGTRFATEVNCMAWAAHMHVV